MSEAKGASVGESARGQECDRKREKPGERRGEGGSDGIGSTVQERLGRWGELKRGKRCAEREGGQEGSVLGTVFG